MTQYLAAETDSTIRDIISSHRSLPLFRFRENHQMLSSHVRSQIQEWVHEGAFGAFPLTDDRSEQVAVALRDSLATPQPIAVVERVEAATKAMWADVLKSGSRVNPETAETFATFFSTLGFFYKYKPYGVKIASPFGYSLFDLKPYEGFSFQLHLEPKLEAFHILQPKAGALVYLSSPEEWETHGRDWAKQFVSDREPDRPPLKYAFRPRQGDVATISETGVVHTALGCFLEEYASTSVDAVERLWDQNSGNQSVLPESHPIVGELLLNAFRGLPHRCLDRTTAGWSETVAGEPTGMGIIEIPDHLRGYRVAVQRHHGREVPSLEDGLSLIVAVDSPIEVSSEDGQWHQVLVGDFRVVAPNRSARVRSIDASSAVIVVHQVTRDMISTDWTRNSNRT